MNSPSRSASSLHPIAYALAALFVLLPLIELALTIWPWQPRGLLWRFGAFGLLAQSLMIPTFGIFVAMLAANTLGHRRFQMLLSVIALLVAVVLLASTGLFLLDATQARATARPEVRGSVTATAIRAAGATFLYALTWIWMGLAAFRSTRTHAPADGKRKRASLVHRAPAPIADPGRVPTP